MNEVHSKMTANIKLLLREERKWYSKIHCKNPIFKDSICIAKRKMKREERISERVPGGTRWYPNGAIDLIELIRGLLKSLSRISISQ
jgi:hypothetical protein